MGEYIFELVLYVQFSSVTVDAKVTMVRTSVVCAIAIVVLLLAMVTTGNNHNNQHHGGHHNHHHHPHHETRAPTVSTTTPNSAAPNCTQEPNHPHCLGNIIIAPVRCPEGQKKDLRGKCRPVTQE